jgi:hypothetical protein
VPLGADALAYHTVSAILHVLITRLGSDGRNKPVHATAVSRAIGLHIATAAVVWVTRIREDLRCDLGDAILKKAVPGLQ